jgi:hypothetical protein
MPIYLPVIYCNKMAVNDVSFCQHAVIEFLNENSSAANIMFVEIPASVSAVYSVKTLQRWQQGHC